VYNKAGKSAIKREIDGGEDAGEGECCGLALSPSGTGQLERGKGGRKRLGDKQPRGIAVKLKEE